MRETAKWLRVSACRHARVLQSTVGVVGSAIAHRVGAQCLRAAGAMAELAGKAADRLLRVETEDYIELGAPRAGGMAAADVDKRSCFPYEPTSHYAFHRLVRLVPDAVAGHTFVDLGCGLGRVVIEAATYPFARVIGVELSVAMADAARRNVARSRRRTRAEVTILAADARDITFTAESYLVYLFNPFGADVLRDVVANLEAAVRDDGADITVIYYNCQYADVLHTSSVFREVRTGRLQDWSAGRACRYAVFATVGRTEGDTA